MRRMRWAAAVVLVATLVTPGANASSRDRIDTRVILWGGVTPHVLHALGGVTPFRLVYEYPIIDGAAVGHRVVRLVHAAARGHTS